MAMAHAGLSARPENSPPIGKVLFLALPADALYAALADRDVVFGLGRRLRRRWKVKI